MKRRTGNATLTALLVGGVVACSAPTPPPASSPGASDAGTQAVESVTPSALPSLSPSPSPGVTGGDLELRFTEVDPAMTWAMLEFGSDGESVIFSSGVADGPNAVAAPDLWRIDPLTEIPELLWRNPRRDRSLIRIGGNFRHWAFVEIGLEGERGWDLWLLDEPGGEPILLDTHPGDEDVSSLVPSFSVFDDRIAWTAFDRGPNGPVSQLRYAEGPGWEPVLIAQRDAAKAELWLPSLLDSLVAYCEVIYSEDRSTDERHVYVADVLHPETEPVRLDTSGRATMPLFVQSNVVWKEADPGFSMFNWGKLVLWEQETGESHAIPSDQQEYVNYPSAGERFVVAWGSDSSKFVVWDHDMRTWRTVERYPPTGPERVMRPHIAGSLAVWLYLPDAMGEEPGRLRFALLPAAGTDRGR